MKLRIILILASLTVFSAVSRAQTPTPPEGTYVIAAGATYSTTGGALDDGSVETIQYHINDYFNARLDAFTFGGGFLASLGRAQAQAAVSHIIKGNEYIDTSRILPFVNVGGGVVKNPNGSTKPGFAVGAGLDYKINNTLTIRAIDFTYLRSTILPGNGKILSNINNVATGIYLTFPTNPTAAWRVRRAERTSRKRAEKAQEEQTRKAIENLEKKK